MNSKWKDEGNTLTIVDAVETLSNIADLEVDDAINIVQSHHIAINDEIFTYNTVHRLQEKNLSATIGIVKETFRVVLDYLKHFYGKKCTNINNTRDNDGIKNIMVLVGEATKKLDRYTTIFSKAHSASISKLKEFRQLKDFYNKKFAINDETPSLKEQDIEYHNKAKTKEGAFLSLDTIKHDTDYELLFMRKEDGKRFFDSSLIRNLKLVCDFSEDLDDYYSNSPLAQVKFWEDRLAQLSSKSILRLALTQIDLFYSGFTEYKNNELVEHINKALMALILSSNPRNLLRNSPVKSCHQYLSNFQRSLRNALATNDYNKLITYPPSESKNFMRNLLSLSNTLCKSFYMTIQKGQELSKIIREIIKQSNKSRPGKAGGGTVSLWEQFENDYESLTWALNNHKHGPLFKVLELFKKGEYQPFDPTFQGDIPNKMWNLRIGNKHMSCLRTPSPTRQTHIHKAEVLYEFKGLLRSYANSPSKNQHLIINVQDRTAWKEYSRCIALEELQNNKEFSGTLTVVTMARNTDFYQQLSPYNKLGNAQSFLQHFKEHLTRDDTGFFFPEKIKEQLFPAFSDNLMQAVHSVFFSNKNILHRSDRLDFIEIFYALMTLKILEIVKPDSFSITCKDGIDASGSAIALLHSIIKISATGTLSPDDIHQLNTTLYGMPMIVRERVMLSEHFERFISALRTIETTQHALREGTTLHKVLKETIGPLFNTPIFDTELTLPDWSELY